MAQYNLLEEGWIPCMTGERAVSLGIRAVLAQAHTIEEITAHSPLVTVALHRLLLAILHRTFGPCNLIAWCDLWRRGQWDMEVLNSYFALWEHRFDLLDTSYPFYQVPPLFDAKNAPKKNSPAARLAQEAATGNNATLFDHQFNQTSQPLSAPEAARQLLATQLFSIGFGNSQPFYAKDASLTRGYTVLCVGSSLFETLALNLVPYNAHNPIPHAPSGDLPVWEEDRPREPHEKGTRPRGYLDYLTWQSRRVHLVSSDDPLQIPSCQIRQNLVLPDDVTDPFRCYRSREVTGRSPVGFNAERSLWRDCQVLFHKQFRSAYDQRVTTTRPDLFDHLARVEQQRRNDSINALPVYRIDAFGFATEEGRPAQITFWRHEQLSVPLAYLDDPGLLVALDTAIEFAESVGRALLQATQRFVAEAFPSGAELKKKRGEDPHVLALAPGRRYWPALETPFAIYLAMQAKERAGAPERGGVPVGRAFHVWIASVKAAAQVDFDTMFDVLDITAQALRARVTAEQAYKGALRRAHVSAGLEREDTIGEQ